MSGIPTRILEPETPRGVANIGKAVLIKGQIQSREDLVVDGSIEGSVELLENRITVGPNGKVNAGIKAREIVIQGTVNGNVEASDKVEIKRGAHLYGDIKTARIIIEDGGVFKGSVDIVRTETKPAPEPPKPQIPVAQQTLAAGAGDAKR